MRRFYAENIGSINIIFSCDLSILSRSDDVSEKFLNSEKSGDNRTTKGTDIEFVLYLSITVENSSSPLSCYFSTIRYRI